MMVNAGVVSNTNAEMPCGGFKIHSWQIMTEYYRFGTVLKSIYTEIWNSISNLARGLARGVSLIFKGNFSHTDPASSRLKNHDFFGLEMCDCSETLPIDRTHE